MPDTLDTVSPSYVYEETRDLGLDISPHESSILTRERTDVSPRKWKLMYTALTAAEVATLLGVYSAAQLADGTTQFTPRGAGAPVTVRFQDTDQLEAQLQTATHRDMVIHAKELL